MPRQFYFAICSYLTNGQPYIMRLVVQRDGFDALVDHYFEYGVVLSGSFLLGESIWSTDPEALLDHMPPEEQFHASMDVRLFQRTDLEDALDGSLMTDEFEIVLDRSGFVPCPGLLSSRVAA